MRYHIGFMIGLLLLSSITFSQDNDSKLTDLQNQLRSIQSEINQLEDKLRSTSTKLQTEMNSLDNLDKQITLINKKINIYDKELKVKQSRISSLESQIGSLKLKIESMKELFTEQVVFAYKYGRGKNIDWILGSTNFNQAMIRYQYFRKVSTAEKSIYEKLEEFSSDLKSKESQLQSEFKATQSLLGETKKEQAVLANKRSDKRQLVQKISQSKSLLNGALKEKKDNYKKIAALIATLERQRKNRTLKPKTQIKWEKLSGSFSKNKGQLHWPVAGPVVHAFGRYKNPKLKTILDNSGIDIRAKNGQPVRCVFSGVVSVITYMSGFGNMVIVDHNDGYYTVYAHLDEVLVNANDFVEEGTSIGTVGESGSLEGPKLHFEIYSDNKPQNPVYWLRKH